MALAGEETEWAFAVSYTHLDVYKRQVYERVLRLRKVEQMDVSPERELMLTLTFSETPDRTQLTRHLHLLADGKEPVEYRIAGPIGTNTVVIETGPVLTEKLQYVLDEGMPAAGDSLPMDRAAQGWLTMSMNLMVQGVETYAEPFEQPMLFLKLNAMPEANGLREFIQIEPAVAFTAEASGMWYYRGVMIRGDFRPGEIYEVSIQKGLPAVNGSSLPATIQRTVQIPLPRPAVQIHAPGAYLSPRSPLRVPVRAVNVTEFTARMQPVFANNLVHLTLRGRDGWWWQRPTDDLGGSWREQTYMLAPGRDGQPSQGEVDLRQLTDGAPKGVYWLEVVQEVTVMEASGRSVTGYGREQMDAYPFYIGMKPAWEGEGMRVGETQRVAIAAVKPDGTTVEKPKPLLVTIQRATWNSVLRENQKGRYEWVSERQVVEVQRDTVALAGEETEWAFAVDAPGVYMLVAEDPQSGAATRISFYAGSAEQSWQAWSREKPGRVELTLDKASYQPGDVARLQVRAPFAGRALLTVEANGVIEARTVELKKNTAEFDVPIQAAYAPNVYCTFTLIRPVVEEEVWGVHRAIGAVAVPVARPGRDLQMELSAPSVARPQATLSATVTVRAADGQPAQGAVTVMAVDEAICMLTAFETPDPAQAFMAQRALGMTAHDLYAALMPVVLRTTESTAAPGLSLIHIFTGTPPYCH